MARSHLEYRAVAELRASGRRLQGYVATFGTEARIADFVETIAAGAFQRTLADGHDIVGLVDHDLTRLLARTRTGTLRLSEDSRGLQFDLSVPDTQLGRDTLALAEREDLGGMSFSFRVRENGERWQGRRRELRSVDLVEVSVVSAFPAYEGTSVAARSRMPPRLALARLFMETV